ncbi:MAG: Na+/H+ antiporter subunit E [Oceanipulchritudo sp.]
MSRFSLATWMVLLALWIILSGKLDLFHLGAGVLTVAFINWQQTALRPLRRRGDPVLRARRLLLYIPWLLWQMLLSSVYVAGIILRDPKGIDPRMVAFRSGQPSMLHRVILANSITLTPGTLTVDLKGDRYLVHALTRRTAEEVLEGKLARKVARLSPNQPDATPVNDPMEHEEAP